MSPPPSGFPPLLLLVLFGSLLSGGLRSPWAWTFAAVPLWTAAIAGGRGFSRLPGGRLWGAWLAWTALSALSCAEPLTAAAAYSRLTTGFLVFALACAHLHGPPARHWFRLLLLSAALLAVSVFLLPASGYPMAGLLFPYKNYAVCVEAAAFSACLGALQAGHPPSRRSKAGVLLLMAFLLWAILSAGSRAGLLACGAAAAVVGLRSRRRLWVLVLLLSAVTAFGLAPMKRLSALLKLDASGSYARPAIWDAALSVARDSPLLGEGPGLFERGFLRHNFPAPWSVDHPTRYGMRTPYAHSELLQAAAETGIPGAGLLLSALAAALLAGLRRPPSWPRTAALSAFCAMSAHALVDNVSALPALGWLHLSALAVFSAGEESPERPPPPLSRPLRVAGLLLAALSWWPRWAVEDAFRRSNATQGGPAILWARAALKVSPADAQLWRTLALAHLKTAPADADAALGALAEAERLSPTDAVHPLTAAEVLRARCRWPATLAVAGRVLLLEPDCQQARLLRAEALWRLDRRREAREELDRLERKGAVSRAGARRGYNAVILSFDEPRYRSLRDEIRSSSGTP